MPVRGLSMDEMLTSRRKDFGDMRAVPPPKPTTKATGATPWYKEPKTYVVAAGIILAVLFGKSLLTGGGRARTPRPFG